MQASSTAPGPIWQRDKQRIRISCWELATGCFAHWFKFTDTCITPRRHKITKRQTFYTIFSVVDNVIMTWLCKNAKLVETMHKYNKKLFFIHFNNHRSCHESTLKTKTVNWQAYFKNIFTKLNQDSLFKMLFLLLLSTVHISLTSELF